MLFDALFLANLLVSFVALVRLRLTCVILGANHVLLARALSNIAAFGQPASEWFLPSYVFASSNLGTGASILSLATVLLLIAVVAPGRSRAPSAVLPEAPSWLLWILLGYFALSTASSSTILSGAHADPDRTRFSLNLGGGHAFLSGLLLYAIYRRVAVGAWSRRRALLLVFAVALSSGYAKGITGFTTGFLVCAVGILSSRGRFGRNGWIRVASLFLAIAVVSTVVRGVRGSIYREGTDAVSTFVSSLWASEESREREAQGIESVGNATQTASHLLECITLYDSGVSREWRSIYNVIEYTFLPSPLLKPLDLERSKEAAWELFEYFIHSGGINAYGEFYWNGGWACVAVMMVALISFCYLLDIHYRHSAPWVMLMCNFAPSFFMGFGYGFAQIARGAINGLLMISAYALIGLRASRSAVSITPPVETGLP